MEASNLLCLRNHHCDSHQFRFRGQEARRKTTRVNSRFLRGRTGTRKWVVKAVATEAEVAAEAKRTTPRNRPSMSGRKGDVSEEIKRVRAQMEENEQLATLMRGLRGQNLIDTQFSADVVRMRLVEVSDAEGGDTLPLAFDPALISAYWGKRPRAVATRIVQLLVVAGGFVSRLIGDLITKKIKENEVSRAIELREIVTSLGPAYIKLGQALSIRPDILSPAAMTDLQKLCNKVPSFPNDVAMSLLEEELGQPWHEIYYELSPSPIAAVMPTFQDYIC